MALPISEMKIKKGILHRGALWLNVDASYNNRITLPQTGNFPLYSNNVLSISLKVISGNIAQDFKAIFAEVNATDTDTNYSIRHSAGGKLRILIKADNGTTLKDITTANPVLTQNSEHHIVFIDNNGSLSLYVDRILVLSDTYTRSSPLTVQATGLGCSARTSPGDFLIGYLGDFAAYSRAISTEDIEKLYYEIIPTNGLICYIPFENDSNDRSGNGYNATVSTGSANKDPRYFVIRRKPIRNFRALKRDNTATGAAGGVEMSSVGALATVDQNVSIFIRARYDILESGAYRRLFKLFKASTGYPALEVHKFQSGFLGKLVVTYTNPSNVKIINDNPVNLASLFGHYEIPRGQFLDIILTIDAVNKVAKLYIDTVLHGSFTYTGSFDLTGVDSLIYGALNTAGTQPWIGWLGPLSIYNTVLTQEDTIKLFMDHNSVTTGLVRKWDFANVTGSTLIDSIAGDNGTIQSGNVVDGEVNRTLLESI